MANPISNWLYTGATPGTQAATQAAAKTTPWGQVGKQILAEGAFGIKGKPGGFGSVNVGFDPKYTGKGATNIGGYIKGGVQSFVPGAKVAGNIAGGTSAFRLAFEKLLQSPLARGVGSVGRLATGPIGAGITSAMLGGQLGDWAYKNWEPATKFGDWAGGGIYDLLNPEETSIDPTNKNLFSQYYEDDPYAGIEDQTAYLQYLPELFALGKAGFSKKKIAQYLVKNKLQKEMGKKVKPIITSVLTGGQAAAAGPSGGGQWVGGSPAYTHQGQGGGEFIDTQGNVDYHDPYDPGGGEAQGGFIDGTNRRRSYFDGGLASLWLR